MDEKLVAGRKKIHPQPLHALVEGSTA